MEQKTQPARRAVRTAPRVSNRQVHCAQRNALVEPSADLRLEPTSIAEPSASRGRVEVVESYFDIEGRPIKHKAIGAARVARRYDERGHQVEEAYFNAEGKPTAREGLGAARVSWRYDDSGHEIEAAFFGPDGAPVRRRL